MAIAAWERTRVAGVCPAVLVRPLWGLLRSAEARDKLHTCAGALHGTTACVCHVVRACRGMLRGAVSAPVRGDQRQGDGMHSGRRVEVSTALLATT